MAFRSTRTVSAVMDSKITGKNLEIIMEILA